MNLLLRFGLLCWMIGLFGQYVQCQRPTIYKELLGAALDHPTLQKELLLSGQHPEQLSCLYTNYLIPSNGYLTYQTTSIPLTYGRPEGGLAVNQAMLLRLSLNPQKARVKLAIGPELIVNLRMRYYSPNWEAERVFVKKRRRQMTSFRWYW